MPGTSTALATICQLSQTAGRKRSLLVDPLCTYKEATLSGWFTASDTADGAAERQTGDMRFGDAHRLHECGNIVGKQLRRIGTVRFVRFARSPQIDGNAGEAPGILRHLKGVTGVIRGQVRNENERLTGSLLVVVHRDRVGGYFGNCIFGIGSHSAAAMSAILSRAR